MTNEYETSIYSKEQLDKARVRGQIKGWVQGTISTVVLLALLKFLSWLWIPLAILIGVLGISGYNHFKKKSNKEDS